MYRHTHAYAGTAAGGTSGIPAVCCARRANTGSLHGKHIGARDGGGRGRGRGEGGGGAEATMGVESGVSERAGEFAGPDRARARAPRRCVASNE